MLCAGASSPLFILPFFPHVFQCYSFSLISQFIIFSLAVSLYGFQFSASIAIIHTFALYVIKLSFIHSESHMISFDNSRLNSFNFNYICYLLQIESYMPINFHFLDTKFENKSPQRNDGPYYRPVHAAQHQQYRPPPPPPDQGLLGQISTGFNTMLNNLFGWTVNSVHRMVAATATPNKSIYK